jgi:hypothetical protein
MWIRNGSRASGQLSDGSSGYAFQMVESRGIQIRAGDFIMPATAAFSETQLIANQKKILENQALILKNQEAIKKNQETLNVIAKNQEVIKKNQETLNVIVKNQEKILAAIRR